MRAIHTMLAHAVMKDKSVSQVQLATTERTAEVWPRVDVGGHAGRGNWYVVLHNSGDGPARDVRFSSEPEWPVLTGSQDETGPDLRALAPHTEVRLILVASMATPGETQGTVT